MVKLSHSRTHLLTYSLMCYTDINECDGDPCQNGGQCVNTHGGYHCVCPPGLLGTDCELSEWYCYWIPVIVAMINKNFVRCGYPCLG